MTSQHLPQNLTDEATKKKKAGSTSGSTDNGPEIIIGSVPFCCSKCGNYGEEYQNGKCRDCVEQEQKAEAEEKLQKEAEESAQKSILRLDLLIHSASQKATQQIKPKFPTKEHEKERD